MASITMSRHPPSQSLVHSCSLETSHKTWSAVAEATGLTAEQAESVYADIRQKRKATRRLHMQPVLLGDI